MKNLFVGCKVRVIHNWSDPRDRFCMPPIVGHETVIIGRPHETAQRMGLHWIIPWMGAEVVASSEALEPILPDGLMDEIRKESEEDSITGISEEIYFTLEN